MQFKYKVINFLLLNFLFVCRGGGGGSNNKNVNRDESVDSEDESVMADVTSF